MTICIYLLCSIDMSAPEHSSQHNTIPTVRNFQQTTNKPVLLQNVKTDQSTTSLEPLPPESKLHISSTLIMCKHLVEVSGVIIIKALGVSACQFLTFISPGKYILCLGLESTYLIYHNS